MGIVFRASMFTSARRVRNLVEGRDYREAESRPVVGRRYGGGTLLPSLHVARELKAKIHNLSSGTSIERNSQFLQLVAADASIDKTIQITCGKWRRYHGLSFVQKLTDVKTNWHNFVECF